MPLELLPVLLCHLLGLKGKPRVKSGRLGWVVSDILVLSLLH
jgi:hypothetical protein